MDAKYGIQTFLSNTQQTFIFGFDIIKITHNTVIDYSFTFG